jgi:hypothetical protein
MIGFAKVAATSRMMCMDSDSRAWSSVSGRSSLMLVRGYKGVVPIASFEGLIAPVPP